MSTTTPTFTTQALGQTEKALGAILGRLLSGSDLTEQQWVTLSVVLNATGEGPIVRARLVAIVAGVLSADVAVAGARITELAAAGYLDAPDADGLVGVSAQGDALYTRIRASVGDVTERLWGDLPEADLSTAGRVLATVIERAQAELAAA